MWLYPLSQAAMSICSDQWFVVEGMPYLQFSVTTRREKNCLNDLFRNNYCRYLYNRCLWSSIKFLKPSTADYAWHVQDLNKDYLWLRGLLMAAMLGPGGPSVAAILGLWEPTMGGPSMAWHTMTYLVINIGLLYRTWQDLFQWTTKM